MARKKMNKKKIFFIINSLEDGGAEKVITTVISAISDKYDIYLILLKKSAFFKLPEGINVIFLSEIKNNLLMIPLFPYYLLRIRKLIKKLQPHKVFSFLEISNFLNILSHKNAIISFRISLDFFNTGSINKIYRVLIKILYPKAAHIIVNSNENKIDLSNRLNITPDKITTIYNPIDLDLVRKLSMESVKLPFTAKKDSRIFITIGRLHAQKRIDQIIELFDNSKLRNEFLLIIGSGKEKNQLESIIKNKKIEKNVFLLGNQKNVYKYLNVSDFFIFNSQAEGFPNALIDALACGLPIITSDFKTGAREIIDSTLTFDQKITYPHYGPNGSIISLNKFKEDFTKIDFDKLKQDKNNLKDFNLKEIIENWNKIIE